MILSEIKGKRGLRTVGKLMAFMERLRDTEGFDEFMECVGKIDGDGGAAVSAILKLGALFDDDELCDELARIVAYGIGADPDDFVENGNLNAELVELLTKDIGSLSFLSATRDAATA